MIGRNLGEQFIIVRGALRLHRVEVGRPEAFDRPRTREEALRRLEESAGPEARKLLEGFLKKVDKLERDQDFSEAARRSGTRESACVVNKAISNGIATEEERRACGCVDGWQPRPEKRVSRLYD